MESTPLSSSAFAMNNYPLQTSATSSNLSEEYERLKEENFGLKLKTYLLEKRLVRQKPNVNVQVNMQLEKRLVDRIQHERVHEAPKFVKVRETKHIQEKEEMQEFISKLQAKEEVADLQLSTFSQQGTSCGFLEDRNKDEDETKIKVKEHQTVSGGKGKVKLITDALTKTLKRGAIRRIIQKDDEHFMGLLKTNESTVLEKYSGLSSKTHPCRENVKGKQPLENVIEAISPHRDQAHGSKQDAISKMARALNSVSKANKGLSNEVEEKTKVVNDLKDTLKEMEKQRVQLKAELQQAQEENHVLEDMIHLHKRSIDDLKEKNSEIEYLLKQEQVQRAELLRENSQLLCTIQKFKERGDTAEKDLFIQLKDCKENLKVEQNKNEALLLEKQILNQQLIEIQESKLNLTKQFEVLNTEKHVIEQENAQYKSRFLNTESLCDHLREELQLTKEKLELLHERCSQYQKDANILLKKNELLSEEKRYLENALKFQRATLTDLSKETFGVDVVQEQESQKETLLRKTSSLMLKEQEFKEKHSDTTEDFQSFCDHYEKYLQAEQQKVSNLLKKNQILNEQLYNVENKNQTLKQITDKIDYEKRLSEEENFRKTSVSNNAELLCSDLRKQLLLAEENLRQLDEKCAQYQKDLMHLKDEKQELVSEKRLLTEAINSQAHQISDLNTKNFELQSMLQQEQTSRRGNETLQSKSFFLTHRIKELGEASDGSQKDLINEYEERSQTFQREIKRLKESMADRERKISYLEKSVCDLMSTKVSLEHKICEETSKLEKLRSVVLASYEVLEKKLGGNESVLQNIMEEKEHIENEMNKLRGAAIEPHRISTDLQDQIQSLMDQTTLEDRSVLWSKVKELCESSVVQKENHIKTLENEMIKMILEIIACNTETSELREELQMKSQAIEQMRQEMDYSRSVAKDVTRQTEKLEPKVKQSAELYSKEDKEERFHDSQKTGFKCIKDQGTETYASQKFYAPSEKPLEGSDAVPSAHVNQMEPSQTFPRNDMTLQISGKPDEYKIVTGQQAQAEDEQLVRAAPVLTRDDSGIHSFKNEMSELQRKYRKTCWRKDILLAAKTMMVQKLKEEVKKTNEAFKKLEAEINEKDYKLCSLEEQLYAIENEKESLAGDKGDLLNRISLYENDAKTLQVRYSEMVKKVKEKHLAQNKSEEEARNLRYQLQIQSSQIENLQEQLDFLEEERVQLANEKGDLCHRVSDHETEASKIRTELRDMKKQIKEIDLAKVSAEKEVEILKNEMQIKNEKIARLQARITAIEQEKTLLMSENDDLCNRISDYESKTRKLKAESDEIKQQLKENDLDKTKAQQEIEKLMNQMQTKNNEIGRLQERISVTKREKDSLAVEKERLCNRISDYETATEKMKIELHEIKDQVKQKYVAQKSTEKELEDQRNRTRLQNMEIERMQSNIKELEEEKSGLFNRIKQHENEIGNIQKELRERDSVQANAEREILDLKNQLQTESTKVGRLQERLHDLEEERKLTQNEKKELSNRIFDYESEVKTIRNQLFYIKEQVRKRDLANIELEYPKISLQTKHRQIDLLKQERTAREQLIFETEKLSEDIWQQTVPVDKSAGSVPVIDNTPSKEYRKRIQDLSGEIQLLSFDLCETKNNLQKKEVICENREREIQNLRNEIECLRSFSSQRKTHVTKDQSDFKLSYMPTQKRFSELQVDSKSVSTQFSVETEYEAADACRLIAKQVEYGEKLYAIEHLQKPSIQLENELRYAKDAVKRLEEQKVILERKLDAQTFTIKTLSEQKRTTHSQLARLSVTNISMNAEQTAFEQKISQLQKELSEKEFNIENLSREKENLNQYLKRELQDKDELIAKLKMNEKENLNFVHQLENTLKDKAKYIDQLSLHLKHSSNRITEFEKKLAKYSDRIEKLNINEDFKTRLIQKMTRDLNFTADDVANPCHDYESKFNVLKKFNDIHEKRLLQDTTVFDHLSENEGTVPEFLNQESVKMYLPMTFQETMTSCANIGTQTLPLLPHEDAEVAGAIEYIITKLKLEDELKMLQHQQSEYLRELQSCKLANQTLEEQNSYLEQKLHESEVLLKKHQENGNVAVAQVSHLEKQIKCMQESENQLKIQLSEISEEMSSKNTSVNNLVEEKQFLQSKVTEYETEINKMRCNLETLETNLTIARNELQESTLFTSEVQRELQEKSLLVNELQICKEEREKQISELEGHLENKMKCINQHSLDIDEKTNHILALRQELDELKNATEQLQINLNSQANVIEKLLCDLRHKTEETNNLEKELKQNLNLIDEYKSKETSRSKLAMTLKESIEEKAEVIKDLEEKLCQKSETIQALDNKVNQTKLEYEDVSRKLAMEEDLLAEKDNTIKHLNEKIVELSSKLPTSLPRMASSTKPKSQSSERVFDNELEIWANRKWSLQKSILQLQMKLFKDAPVPLPAHFSFSDRIEDLQTVILPNCLKRKSQSETAPCGSTHVGAHEEKQKSLLAFKADVEFLQNIKNLLKHFVIPLLKCTTNFQSSLITLPLDKSDEEIENRKESKRFFTSFSAVSLEHEDGDSLTSLASYHGCNMRRKQSPAYGSTIPRKVFSETVAEHYLREKSKSHRFPGRGDECFTQDSFRNLIFGAEEDIRSKSRMRVVGGLEDFELLRKTIEECLTGMNVISCLMKEGLKILAKKVPAKCMQLECHPLEEALNSCNFVEMCLQTVEKLIKKFRFIPSTVHGEAGDFDAVFQENQILKQRLKELVSQQKETKLAFEESQENAEAKARTISKQLVETKKVLRKARKNFEKRFGSCEVQPAT